MAAIERQDTDRTSSRAVTSSVTLTCITFTAQGCAARPTARDSPGDAGTIRRRKDRWCRCRRGGGRGGPPDPCRARREKSRRPGEHLCGAEPAGPVCLPAVRRQQQQALVAFVSDAVPAPAPATVAVPCHAMPCLAARSQVAAASRLETRPECMGRVRERERGADVRTTYPHRRLFILIRTGTQHSHSSQQQHLSRVVPGEFWHDPAGLAVAVAADTRTRDACPSPTHHHFHRRLHGFPSEAASSRSSSTTLVVSGGF